MKRHKSLIPLSDDHHKGLLLSQLIKKNAPNYKELPNDIEGKVNYTENAWNNELKFHFINEEKILFPFVKGKDEVIDNLITELLQEHRLIKNLIASLKENKNAEEQLNEIGHILQKHIRTEERELFPRIQEIIGEKKLMELENKIESVSNYQIRISKNK